MSEAAGDNTWADLVAEGRLPRLRADLPGRLAERRRQPGHRHHPAQRRRRPGRLRLFLVGHGGLLRGRDPGRRQLGPALRDLRPALGHRAGGRGHGGRLRDERGWRRRGPVPGRPRWSRAWAAAGSPASPWWPSRMLFPERHLARVFAAVTFIWGIATVLGPLFGGVGGRGRPTGATSSGCSPPRPAVFSAAAPSGCCGRRRQGAGRPGHPLDCSWASWAWRVAAIAVADLAPAPRARHRPGGRWAWPSWPWSSGSTRRAPRAPAAAPGRRPDRPSAVRAISPMFASTAASMGFAIYGPPILQHAARLLAPVWPATPSARSRWPGPLAGHGRGRRRRGLGHGAGRGSARCCWSPAW